MKTIKDEFTKLKGKISRQRLYQLRKKRDGRCTICGKKAVYSFLCSEHQKKQNYIYKKWVRKNGLVKKPRTKLTDYNPYGKHNAKKTV